MKNKVTMLEQALVPHEQPFNLDEAQAAVLADSLHRQDVFATDSSDEFKVRREDGREQGIFKVWAPHIMPQLDLPLLDPEQATRYWTAAMEHKPLALYESLEEWRAFSEIADRRLQTVFSRRELPEEPVEAAAELFLRLKVAFTYAAPFYNLEALVVDPRQDPADNPIDFAEHHAGGGQLDTVAMVLPAALSEYLTADEGDWHGLTWERIQQQVRELQADFHATSAADAAQHDYALLLRVANRAHVEPEDVLFAANSLQFIPANVGGKREDMDTADAKDVLFQILQEPDEVTTGVVAKNANALIRFLNWCPAVRSAVNFEGKLLSYGAVCDTASELAEFVSKHVETVFEGSFAGIYNEQLKDQINGLDATSPKGRFLFQLLEEGVFAPELEAAIELREADFNEVIHEELEALHEAESLLPLNETAPTYLIGGKSEGIRRAIALFGAEKVADGFTLTSETVNEWLYSSPDLKDLIDLLELADNIDAKTAIAKDIRQAISAHPEMAFGVEHLAAAFSGCESIVLRSSSYDEDVDIIGPAPGIYESVVGVDPHDAVAIDAAIRLVVSSFFSDKAINFREMKGLRHKPLFAVIAQECLTGIGGSAFIKDGHVRLNIAPTAEKINHLGFAALIEAHEHKIGEAQNLTSNLLSEELLTELLAMAAKAEVVMGPSDFEFAIDGNGRLKVLQLRSLEHPEKHVSHEEALLSAEPVAIGDLNSLPDIEGVEHANLIIDHTIDLESFQGALFRWIVSHRQKVVAITVPHNIPATCHFANIVESLGIQLIVPAK